MDCGNEHDQPRARDQGAIIFRAAFIGKFYLWPHREANSLHLRALDGVVGSVGSCSGWIVRHSAKACARLSCRLNSNFVVHGSRNALDTAEIALGCLHRDMAEKELNLLKFTPGCPT